MDDAPYEYPALLEIDYPDRELNRLTTFFRPFMVIPIAIILVLVGGGVTDWGKDCYSFAWGGILFLPTALMLLLRRKYPGWWFDWNLAFMRFNTRVSAYLLLLTDEYPSTDEEQSVHLEIPYPDARYELNRWLPLVKWPLSGPALRLRGGRVALVDPRGCLCVPAHDGPVSAVPAGLRQRLLTIGYWPRARLSPANIPWILFA